MTAEQANRADIDRDGVITQADLDAIQAMMLA
jgi:hypothetical protein